MVVVRPEAERDLADVRDWYRQKAFHLGDDFLDAVAIAIRRLEKDPERERFYYRSFHRVILRRFPYKLF